MMTFLAVPAFILLIAFFVGVPIVAIQKWQHRHALKTRIPARSVETVSSPGRNRTEATDERRS